MKSWGQNWVWWGIAMLLTGVKLWLTRGQGIFAIGNATHDDFLFIKLAHHLINHDWLGPYNELTLSKGPFYPLFIAASYGLGVPLFLSQHLFYTLACGLFTRALRPAITSCGIRASIYLVLLWNPMTFDMPGMGRVLRQQVYGPLALMIFSGLVALYYRRTHKAKRLLPWSILTGLALGAFYLTREETLWIAPSILLLATAYFWGSAKQSAPFMSRALGQLAVIVGIAIVPIATISVLNYHHYGWFGTSEFRSPEFKQAYGAITRIRLGPDIPFVPVTRTEREALATISPKFAELQTQFDTGSAQLWARASEFFTKIPSPEEQIGGGWLVWAIRDATAKSGHASSASEAIRFYAQLAQEINLACEQGLLPAGPRYNGYAPAWSPQFAGQFVSNLQNFTDFVARFSLFSARPNPSIGSPEQLQLFRSVTGERLSSPEGARNQISQEFTMLNIWRTETLHQIGRSIRLIIPYLFYICLTVLVGRAITLLWQRKWNYPLTLATAALGACAASLFIHALIETTSFPVLTVTSFAPIYPMVLVMIIAVCWDLSKLRLRPPAPFSFNFNLTNPSDQGPTLPHSFIGIIVCLALLPLLIWHHEFRKLIWFGDDLFLLDQISQMGLLNWTKMVFSENFVPLFKVLWGQAVFTFDGSYLAMIWILWLSHAINTGLFASILKRSGFSSFSTILCSTLFALTPGNIETLGWSVQWSAVLATGFLLLGIDWLLRHPNPSGKFSVRIHLPLFLFATASACSFSRGVLTGGVLALGLILPMLESIRSKSILKQLPAICLCLLPSIIVALIIKSNSIGNHQHISGHWGEVLGFGFSFYLLNPFHALLGETSLHPITMLLLSGGKLAIILIGLVISRGQMRLLLVLLLAYDLGNALLLGIGRYNTGFFAALSSRYQYSSLIATLPSLGLLLSAAVNCLPSIRSRRVMAICVSSAALIYCLLGWPAALEKFTGWRGTAVRELLAQPTTNDPHALVPALELMHIERAKALQRAFHLH